MSQLRKVGNPETPSHNDWGVGGFPERTLDMLR